MGLAERDADILIACRYQRHWNSPAGSAYHWSVRALIALPLCLVLLACESAAAVNSSGETEDEVGARPYEPGAVYSPCGEPDACAPLPYCVFPSGEQGFCTAECVAVDDPSGCPDDPAGLGRAFCLDIGLPSGQRVCAIDCDDGLPCPDGMRCEAVQTDAGPARACF